MEDAAIDARMLAAALDCFATFGTHKTSLSDVAGAAGVSRSTVYRVFGDKDGLIEAIVAAEVTRFQTALDGTVPRELPMRESLRRTVAFTLDYLNEHAVFQRIREREPEQLIEIVVQRAGRPSVLDLIRPFAEDRLRRSSDATMLRVPIEQAAEWMVRLAISMLLTPSSVIPDAGAVADLLLSGITGPAR